MLPLRGDGVRAHEYSCTTFFGLYRRCVVFLKSKKLFQWVFLLRFLHLGYQLSGFGAVHRAKGGHCKWAWRQRLNRWWLLY